MVKIWWNNLLENKINKFCEKKGGPIVQNIWWTYWEKKIDWKFG